MGHGEHFGGLVDDAFPAVCDAKLHWWGYSGTPKLTKYLYSPFCCFGIIPPEAIPFLFHSAVSVKLHLHRILLDRLFLHFGRSFELVLLPKRMVQSSATMLPFSAEHTPLALFTSEHYGFFSFIFVFIFKASIFTKKGEIWLNSAYFNEVFIKKFIAGHLKVFHCSV